MDSERLDRSMWSSDSVLKFAVVAEEEERVRDEGTCVGAMAGNG